MKFTLIFFLLKFEGDHINSSGYKFKIEFSNININIEYIEYIYIIIRDKIATINNNKANLIKYK